MRTLVRASLCAFVLLATVATLRAQTKTADASTDKLIEQLGSDDPAVRKKATEDLIAKGETILPQLRKAVSSSGDPDLRLRAAVVATSITKKMIGEIRKWDVNKDIAWAVAISPDSKFALVGGGEIEKNGTWENGKDLDIRLIDLSNGKEVRKFSGHTGAITASAWLPDGKTALSCSSDKTIRAWDVSNGKELRKYEGHTDRVQCMVVSPDGKQILTGSRDGTVRFWSSSEVKNTATWHPGHGQVWCLAFSADGTYIATGGDDSSARLDHDGQQYRTFYGHSQAVKGIAFGPDGKQLVSGSLDQSVIVWNITTGQQTRRIQGHTDRIECLAIAPGGNQVLTGSLDKKVRLIDMETGNVDHEFEGNTKGIGSVTFAPDGFSAFSSGWDGTVRQFRLAVPVK